MRLIRRLFMRPPNPYKMILDDYRSLLKERKAQYSRFLTVDIALEMLDVLEGAMNECNTEKKSKSG